MTADGGEHDEPYEPRCRCLRVYGGTTGHNQGKDDTRKARCKGSLAGVEQKRCRGSPLANLSRDVRRADVA